MRSVESVLIQDEPLESAWMNDLQASRYTLQAMIEKEDAEIVLLEDEDLDLTQEIASNDGEASNEATNEIGFDADADVNILPLNEAATE